MSTKVNVSEVSGFQGETGRPALKGVPWYIWCGALAITSSSIGFPWDISWHRSVGRDTFWIPAHMLIYGCGVLAAISCGYVILITTFGNRPKMRRSSVNILGFRAPLGSFLAAWGGIAMMTAAPFDNWWHEAYGLDVKIISPPHVLLLFGLAIIALGIFVLILGAMNRAVMEDPAQVAILQGLLLYVGGLMLANIMIEASEFTLPQLLHVVYSYKALAIPIPFLFAFFSQSSRHRWAATWCAAIYTLSFILEILILPLFPAQPKLGPVYVQVTHLVPPRFPILIIAPALALDLLWQHTMTWRRWKVALLSGVVFTGVLVAVEWPFATFLMSKASENRFFGTMYYEFFNPPNSYERLRIFMGPSSGLSLWKGLVKAVIYAGTGSWAGLSFGHWMRRLQR